MTWRLRRILFGTGFLLIIGAWFVTPVFIDARRMAWNWSIQTLGRFTGHETIVSTDVQSRLESLLADTTRLQAELNDYRILRRQLQAPALADWQAIPALIVGRPLDTFHSQLLVNRGTADGVTLGTPAIIHSSVLIGFVSTLQENSAIVTLLFHPTTALAADVVSSDEKTIQGLVKGVRYTSLQLTTVPRDLPLVSGQQVITRGRPHEIPHGLLIGTTKNIISDETAVYQEATLDIPYDPDALRAVVLLRS